jgi:uncharacterized membrane protein YgcG
MRRAAVFLATLCATASLGAQERILSYNSVVEIRRDGSLDVTEFITVHAEGIQIRRGIYRDFPTQYRDSHGNGVRVDLQVLSVERNNVMEPWFTERLSNGVRINTGNDNFLPVPADYTYTLRYHTTRQLGFFPDHDELYWNAIGTGWIFPIEHGSVEVRFPAPVSTDSIRVTAYTGPQGAKGSDYTANLPSPGIATFQLTKPLDAYEGFTIVIGFPKGVVHEPNRGEKAGWFLSDNRGVLVALLGLLLLLVYMIHEWRLVGRDPPKGIIIARYEPRDGQTPAGLRFMKRMGYDVRCFTADVLALAVAGRLRIAQEKHFLHDEWSLERGSEPATKPISFGEEALLDGLFPHGEEDTLVLKNSNASIVNEARKRHEHILENEFEPRFFKLNGGKVALAALLGVVSGVAAFIFSHGYGIPAIIAICALMVASLIIFGRLIRAPTTEGRALLDEIEGLKLYMSVAERQELASMKGPDEPPLDAERYEAMLPFAVALDVEEAWTNKFTAAVGAAAAAEAANNIGWYSGRGPISNLGDFSNALGSSLSSTISSAATPPGSSSGFGGGGGSGGGGGGGGGGGR